MNAAFVIAHFNFEGLGFGFKRLLGGDEAIVFHAFNDVELAGTGTLGIADGVVGRGRFGQASQHGGLGNGNVFQGFAKISFGSRRKAVGAVA